MTTPTLEAKYAIYNSTTGEIISIGGCHVEDIDLQPIPAGCAIFKGAAAFTDLIDVTTGALRPGGKGVSPGPDYDWDTASATWVPNLDRAKTTKKAAVEVERDRRIYDVIVYDTANLDADPVSVDRLAKKISCVKIQVEQGVVPPTSTLVWRDHDNVMHSFADLASYQTWLQGLALAIDTRAMTAWGWSWDKKATIDAAATLADVNAIDPTV